MTDDLRQGFNSDDSMFDEEQEDFEFDDFGDFSEDYDEFEDYDEGGARRGRRGGGLLGLSPFQRLVLAGWMLFLSFLLGTLCLVFTNRIVLPF